MVGSQKEKFGVFGDSRDFLRNEELLEMKLSKMKEKRKTSE